MPRRAAEAKWKACRAVELMMEGKTYDQIARGVGYANRGTAHRVVATALAERLADDIDVLRTLEGDRLDVLQSTLWPAAVNGDVRAAGIIVRIVQPRCRLFGLYPTRDTMQPNRNLVLSSEGAADGYRGHTQGEDHSLPPADIPFPAGNIGKATEDHDAATA